MYSGMNYEYIIGYYANRRLYDYAVVIITHINFNVVMVHSVPVPVGRHSLTLSNQSFPLSRLQGHPGRTRAKELALLFQTCWNL